MPDRDRRIPGCSRSVIFVFQRKFSRGWLFATTKINDGFDVSTFDEKLPLS